MFRVTLMLGGNVVRKYPFDKEKVVVGRDADCEISINNVAVSRRHASIEKRGDQYILEDMHSGNGTFFNEEKIVSHPLANGDTFVIGKYSLTFELIGDVEEQVRDTIRKAGGEDATFRLDRKELDKLISKAGKPGEGGKGTLTPAAGGAPIPLNRAFHFAGSASDCTIPASGFMVAPRIAIFVRDEGGMRLIRVGGKMGKLLVNGQAVDTRILREGDTIEVCGAKFSYSEA
jgi:pSer/pThr/pTyr-binding forkhead associated (FHA) protein